MKIKLLVSRQGPGISQERGDILQVGKEVTQEESQRLIRAEQAIEIPDTQKSGKKRKAS